MIEEIFIVNNNNKVLFGDASRYLTSEQPTCATKTHQLTQLSINDVRLAVLYKNTDVFTALDYLKKLKTVIESKIGKLTENRVLDNYFILLPLMTKDLVIFRSNSSCFPLIYRNDVYVDLVEEVDVIYGTEKVLCHKISAKCYVNTKFAENTEMKILCRTASILSCKSTMPIIKNGNQLEVSKIYRHGTELGFSYLCQPNFEPLIKIVREEQGYSLECKEPTYFKYLVVNIAMPRSTYKVKMHADKGNTKYEDKESLVRWQFNEEEVANSRLGLTYETLDAEEDEKYVTVDFRTQGASITGTKIERIECPSNENITVWIRYNNIARNYELRL